MRYYFVVIKRSSPGTSLAVQWLGLCLRMHRVQVQFLVRDLIAHMPHSQKTKQKQCCNKFNKDFSKTMHIKKIFHKKEKKLIFLMKRMGAARGEGKARQK